MQPGTAVHDFGEPLVGIPAGSWVALSADETHVVAYAAELRDAIREANGKGEQNPIILRVPVLAAPLVL